MAARTRLGFCGSSAAYTTPFAGKIPTVGGGRMMMMGIGCVLWWMSVCIGCILLMVTR